MSASTPKIKIPKIISHKPVKIPLTIPYELNNDLEAYAKIYESAWRETVRGRAYSAYAGSILSQ